MRKRRESNTTYSGLRGYGGMGGKHQGASICRPHLRQGWRAWNLGQNRLRLF